MSLLRSQEEVNELKETPAIMFRAAAQSCSDGPETDALKLRSDALMTWRSHHDENLIYKVRVYKVL